MTRPPPRRRPDAAPDPGWGAVSIDTARLRIHTADGEHLLILEQRHDAAAVGEVTLRPSEPRAGVAELRVSIATPHRRRGMATEAVAALLSHAFTLSAEGGWGLRRVWVRTTSSNRPAVALARRLGFKREARLRQHVVVQDVGVDDELRFAVMAEEWDTEAHRRRGAPETTVGVGPHPQPWPEDPRLDQHLLRDGDRRNVADRYRYWTVEAIRADLVRRSHPFEVAIENWRHDLNIGTVVRNANAFGARRVHVVGRRSWNRRGAMVTDRYLDVQHHARVEDLLVHARDAGLRLVGIDNVPGSTSLLRTRLPRACLLVFGQEGPGLSDAVRRAADAVLHIPQVGSTRSINAGVASGIAMTCWLQQHGEPPADLSC